ncbi:MAG: hypothetical protein QOE55_5385 [Acidobacteriaceae bacterium]|nr:hypothetical protein [Acidobacteriaceae bacterium]
MKVQVIVQPVSGRLPEARYDAWREQLRNRVEFKAEVPFDKKKPGEYASFWPGAQVAGETAVDVRVTPTLGRWSLLFFLLPFLGHCRGLAESHPGETEAQKENAAAKSSGGRPLSQ